MSTVTYNLKSILAAISKTKSASKVEKRILFDNAVLGGLSSNYLKLIFISLPIIEYIALFNPVVFNYLGIAQSIIFYIVFLSVVMIIIFVIAWRNNKRVITKISSSWSEYFPDIDLKMVLSSGVTPYSDFFNKYAKIVKEDLDDKTLYAALKDSFLQMESENSDLLEAMNRAKQNEA